MMVHRLLPAAAGEPSGLPDNWQVKLPAAAGEPSGLPDNWQVKLPAAAARSQAST